ncbi:hypothetical protein EMPS_04680 [Entomortierella parvispora]|uniref:Uncharacterized protein n=1 Tax=Entomortierella parvispora TaxID=205924 RepID=A0A9P3LVQ9_9FUNG|nr:hypothetical protein EMPS_04680 [Entomortierella parvispora]
MFQKLWPFNNATSSQGNGQPSNEPEDHGVSTKVKPIHASFNKGIPLNMKIVVRGDIRTGKTSLFERLQGHPFRPDQDYRTTDQIQVANIPWQYPQTKDIIKVEVWDVVDKGVQSGELKTTTGGALKMEHNAPMSPTKSKSAAEVTGAAPHAGFALDASTIDVYRNTDGVILLYDISKPWTFEYAARALNDIPTNIPVLILSNFSDDSNPRPVIASGQVEALMEEHNEERYKHPCAPANLVRHLDSSMKTGLGLKEIHESFGIPFLNVLRETHRKQFDQKTLEIGELLQTLDGKTQERTSKPSVQRANSNNSTSVVSPKDSQGSKALPTSNHYNKSNHNTMTIQTSGPAMIPPVPQTSSPTSPARKTRNDHTNVDILSPTPVSAQTPAVLFDFNSGKLEDEFFQNVDLDSNTPAAPTKVRAANVTANITAPIEKPAITPSATFQSVHLGKDSMESDMYPHGNPMVAGDEDLGDSSRDELADVTSYHSPPLQPPGWGPGQIEQELLSRHQGALKQNESDAEDVEDIVDRDETASDGFEGDESLQDIDLHHNGLRPLYHADSDVESQHDYPIASAMYYEHEPSGFAAQSDDNIIAESLSAAPTAPVVDIDSSLSAYKEITSVEQGKNPWGSTGDLLSTKEVTVAEVPVHEDADLPVSAHDLENVELSTESTNQQDTLEEEIESDGHGTAKGSSSSETTQVEEPIIDIVDSMTPVKPEEPIVDLMDSAIPVKPEEPIVDFVDSTIPVKSGESPADVLVSTGSDEPPVDSLISSESTTPLIDILTPVKEDPVVDLEKTIDTKVQEPTVSEDTKATLAVATASNGVTAAAEQDPEEDEDEDADSSPVTTPVDGQTQDQEKKKPKKKNKKKGKKGK